jgi:recombinational DNA repair ATPase RecF
LLDDVSSELDRTRNERLFDVLSRLGSQVFLTTTHHDHILLNDNRTDFQVVNGAIAS